MVLSDVFLISTIIPFSPKWQELKVRNNIIEISFFILCRMVSAMISLRVSATKSANTSQIENPHGFL
jgi:hypothetical protein